MPFLRVVSMSLLLVSGAIAFTVAHAAAGVIFKCVSGGVTRYQDSPCGGVYERVPFPGGEEAASSEPSTSKRAARDLALSAAAGKPIEVLPFRETGALALGISDTLVLNRPDWGRPLRIARTRGPEGFHEVWTYGATAAGEVRSLEFLNGRLAAIDVQEGPAAVAPRSAAEPHLATIERAGSSLVEDRRIPVVASGAPGRNPVRADRDGATIALRPTAVAPDADTTEQPAIAFGAGYDPPVAALPARETNPAARDQAPDQPIATARAHLSTE